MKPNLAFKKYQDIETNLDRIRGEIMAYIDRCFACTRITPSSDLRDELCMDSLDIVELINHLEQKYKIEFVGEFMPPIDTVEDLAQHTLNLILAQK